jgi:hypothetical protein
MPVLQELRDLSHKMSAQQSYVRVFDGISVKAIRRLGVVGGLLQSNHGVPRCPAQDADDLSGGYQNLAIGARADKQSIVSSPECLAIGTWLLARVQLLL